MEAAVLRRLPPLSYRRLVWRHLALLPQLCIPNTFKALVVGVLLGEVSLEELEVVGSRLALLGRLLGGRSSGGGGVSKSGLLGVKLGHLSGKVGWELRRLGSSRGREGADGVGVGVLRLDVN